MRGATDSLSYRQRLLENYLSTHFAFIREVSAEACEGQISLFWAYYSRFLPEDKSARILDLGCGFGNFLYFLKKAGYRNILGVDISAEQAEAAKALGIEGVRCEDAFSFLRGRGEEFDCIFALDLIEHLTKDEILELLDGVHQVLRPGGQLVLHLPNGASPFAGMIHYGDFTHETFLTGQSLRQVLSASGFEGIEVCPTGPVVHGLMSLGRWVFWQAIQCLLRFYLLVETGQFRGHILTQTLIAAARKKSRGASL